MVKRSQRFLFECARILLSLHSPCFPIPYCPNSICTTLGYSIALSNYLPDERRSEREPVTNEDEYNAGVRATSVIVVCTRNEMGSTLKSNLQNRTPKLKTQFHNPEPT